MTSSSQYYNEHHGHKHCNSNSNRQHKCGCISLDNCNHERISDSSNGVSNVNLRSITETDEEDFDLKTHSTHESMPSLLNDSEVTDDYEKLLIMK